MKKRPAGKKPKAPPFDYLPFDPKVNQPFDVRRKDLLCAYNPATLDDMLQEACDRYEEHVAPFLSNARVTASTQGAVILFRGKHCQLKPTDPSRDPRCGLRDELAVEALQCLYDTQQCIAENDIKRALMAWTMFIDADDVVFHFDQTGEYPIEERRRAWHASKAQSSGGRATRKWTDEVAQIAREIFAAEKGNGRGAYKRTWKMLRQRGHTDISLETVEKKLRSETI